MKMFTRKTYLHDTLCHSLLSLPIVYHINYTSLIKKSFLVSLVRTERESRVCIKFLVPPHSHLLPIAKDVCQSRVYRLLFVPRDIAQSTPLKRHLD